MKELYSEIAHGVENPEQRGIKLSAKPLAGVRSANDPGEFKQVVRAKPPASITRPTAYEGASTGHARYLTSIAPPPMEVPMQPDGTTLSLAPAIRATVTPSDRHHEVFYSPSPNTSQLQPRLIRPLADAARMKARRTLRSLGEGGLKGFGEFRKDTSELCSEELHPLPQLTETASKRKRFTRRTA
jgi:hypothetical protein